MGVTFGGRACVIPEKVRDYCLRHKLPVGDWWTRANGYVNPLGPGPGTGWLLLRRGDLDELDLNARHDLVIGDGRRDRTAKGLVVTAAEAVAPGPPDDAGAVYAVRVADRRQLLLHAAPVSAGYNVRDLGGSYQAETLNGGAPWTWAELVDDLWAAALPDDENPGLPATPSGVPEGFRFYAGYAYDALNHVLAAAGCALRYAETTDTFDIVRLGADTNDADQAALDRPALPVRRDADPLTPDVYYGRVERAVRVLFPRRPAPTNGADLYYAVTLDATDAAVLAKARPGTVATIHGGVAALGSSGTPSNAAALATRAAELRDDYYRQALKANARLSRVYDGIRTEAAVRPGPVVNAVAFSDRGRGYETEITRTGRLVTVAAEAPPEPGGGGGCCEHFSGASPCTPLTNTASNVGFDDILHNEPGPQSDAYLRVWRQAGLWPSGMMFANDAKAQMATGLMPGYLYASPFCPPKRMTVGDLLVFMHQWPYVHEGEPGALVKVFPTGVVRLGIYGTLTSTDLRPGDLIAQTALTTFDANWAGAGYVGAIGTYPLGGHEFFDAADEAVSNPVLNAGQLYWFAVYWKPANGFAPYGDLGGFHPGLLHVTGFGGTQATHGLAGTGAIVVRSRFRPIDYDEVPSGHPVFGWWYGYDVEDIPATVEGPGSQITAVPTLNGLRCPLTPNWFFDDTADLLEDPEFLAEPCSLPAAWPETGTRVNVLARPDITGFDLSNFLHFWGTPYVYVREQGHAACAAETDDEICLTADALCLSLPYVYDAGGGYSGTELVTLLRTTPGFPAVFTGTARFAGATADEVLIDLALTVIDSGAAAIPPLAGLTAVVQSLGGSPPADDAVTLSDFANYGLDVTACNPFALAFQPNGGGTDPLVMELAENSSAVTITGGTASEDLTACDEDLGECPSTTLCARLPVVADGGLPGTLVGTLTLVNPAASPRVWQGAVSHTYGDGSGLRGFVRLEVTTGTPNTYVFKVLSVGSFDIGTYNIDCDCSFTLSDPEVVCDGDDFLLLVRHDGGSWETFEIEGLLSSCEPVTVPPNDAPKPIQIVPEAFISSSYGSCADGCIDHLLGGVDDGPLPESVAEAAFAALPICEQGGESVPRPSPPENARETTGGETRRTPGDYHRKTTD